MKPNESILIAADPDQAVALAADRITEILSHEDRSTHPSARSIALAGGQTPKPLYKRLTTNPYRRRIDWPQIHFFWSDERAVPPNHPDSNYNMARQTLLEPLSIPADRIHPMPADTPDVGRAALAYEQTIRHILPANAQNIPVFDLILLGLGPDGHTASLFPGTCALHEQQRLIVANWVDAQNAWRMTMAYPLLQAASNIVILATGANKAHAVAQVLAPNADPNHWPAAGLTGRNAHITWILDNLAARLVPQSRSK